MVDIDVDDGTAEGAIAATELVASTLEALQARVDDEDRQALRGAIVYHPPMVDDAPAADDPPDAG